MVFANAFANGALFGSVVDEHGRDLAGRLPIHSGYGVGVNVEREAGRGMAETATYDTALPVQLTLPVRV
jgi:hypothetical protein